MRAVLTFCSVFLFVAAFGVVSGKIFTKCELAKEMNRLGALMEELPDWVCAARWENNYNTSAVGRVNKNGSQDFGIFQINNKWWCKSPGKASHNECHVNCSDLLSDNITKSVRCAMRIKRRQGFEAWYAWRSHCQTNKPSVKECF